MFGPCFRLRGAVAVLAASCTLISCDRPEDRPLRVGINPWPGHAYLQLAEERGIFAAEGAQVRVVEYSSLADLRRAFELGQIDVMGVTAVEMLQAREHSERHPQAFFVTDFSSGGDVVLARPPIATVPQLKGRRIGLEPASLNLYVVARALEQAGLTLRDVTLVPLNQSDVPAAMAAGTVDAVVTYSPYADAVRAAGGANEVYSTRAIPTELPSLLVCGRHVAECRSDDLTRLIRAFLRAAAYAEARPDDAVPLMSRRMRMSEEQFTGALAGITRVDGRDRQLQLLGAGGAVEQALLRAERCLRPPDQTSATADPSTYITRAPVAALGGH